MKSKTKIKMIGFVILFVISSVSLMAETVSVITKENAIRTSCRFFAPVLVVVRYNDKLEVISQEGDWFMVKFKNIEGCIHKSAVQKQTFKFTDLGLGESKSATEDEVALAGKGFNPEVEDAYKKENPELKFELVDTIEGIDIPEEKYIDFIEEGELNLP